MKKQAFFLLFFMLSFTFVSCAWGKAEPVTNPDKTGIEAVDAAYTPAQEAEVQTLAAPAAPATGEVITPGPEDPPTVASYSEWFYLLYGALILIFGEIGKLFGWKDALPKYKYVFVVVAFGIVAGAGFLWHGMSFIMVFLTLASTLGVYDVLTGIFKKKTAVPAASKTGI